MGYRKRARVSPKNPGSSIRSIRRGVRRYEQTTSASIASARRVPYLPPEIIGGIAEHVNKSHLKHFRLVSKVWQAVTTPLLFDRIYVSPRGKDLEVFREITTQPILAASIKQLVYDVSVFSDVCRKDYFKMMCEEMGLFRLKWGWKVALTVNVPEPMKQLFHTVAPEHQAIFLDRAVIRDGHTQWIELMKDELGRLYSGGFFVDLHSGLSRLPSLRSVRMDQDVWGTAIYRHGAQDRTGCPLDPPVEGSPLSRQWKPFHPLPRKPANTDPFNQSEHLRLMVRALCTAKRNIKEFDFDSCIDSGLPPTVFSNRDNKDSLHQDMKSSLWRLETLYRDNTLGFSRRHS